MRGFLHWSILMCVSVLALCSGAYLIDQVLVTRLQQEKQDLLGTITEHVEINLRNWHKRQVAEALSWSLVTVLVQKFAALSKLP